MCNNCRNSNSRITEHPVLDFSKPRKEVSFTFNGEALKGFEGEPIIAALQANHKLKLKEGAKKHTPFGPFCLQGRCCSCAMTVNGKPNVMTCVTMLEEGTSIKYTGGESDVEIFKAPPSKKIDISPSGVTSEHPKCDIAIIGAGPAGIEAALNAAQAGVKSIVLLDDKNYLGGQLALQTHSFFGTKELGASVRGNEIANIMQKELEKTSVDVRLNSTVVGLYPQNMLAFRDQDKLNFLMAKKIICATGASEKFLAFEGNCLPGVIGAGGAQTFMNLYGVKPGKKVLIIGGGNIGVILAYQLIQAGVEVAALIEGSNRMGAYEVHVNKTKALGVPIFTRHTIKKAHGTESVTGATIVEVDDKWAWKEGTEKYFDVDTICLAVGLSPLNELLWQANCEFDFVPHLGELPKFDKYRQTTNQDIFVAGDCAVIGEASIARLEGRIAGLKAALDLGKPHPEFNAKMDEAFRLLDNIQTGMFGKKLGEGKGKVTKSAPQKDFKSNPFTQKLSAKDFVGKEKRVLINCNQEIPCNPCESHCHLNAIKIGSEINQQPSVDFNICKGCSLCVPACPGRAIRVLQYNYEDSLSALTLPFEFLPYPKVGEELPVYSVDATKLCTGKVIRVQEAKKKTECGMVTISLPKEHAFTATAIQLKYASHVQNKITQANVDKGNANKTYVCRCEEVTYDEIVEYIKKGYTTINELKRLTRVGMGQCRGLSCTSVIEGILKQELKQTPNDILEVKKHRRSIFRPPVKRITLGEAAKLKFSDDEIKLFEGIEHVRTVPQELVNTFIAENHIPEKKLKAKHVIIGGGIGGVMTAWNLAQMGESDVIVLEKDFLAAGKTGAALGGIRTGFNTANKVARAKHGLEVYKNAKTLIGEDVGWYQGGYVYLSFDENQDQLFKNSFKTWEEAPVQFYYTANKNEFNKFVPGVDVDRIVSLVHFPEAGGANPFRATYMFAESAKKKGVRFINNQEVVNLNIVNGAIKSVITFDKKENKYVEIECENAVNAAGTNAVKVSKMAGIDLSDQIWIERHGAFITEKMPMWLDPLIVSYHPTLSGYWQQKRMEENIKEGEIVACYSPDEPIKGFNTNSFIYFLSRMAKSILLCQPSLADVGIIRNFAEHYVGRKSGIPLIGETPIKGFWHNIAKKGHGFMCAPGDGFALAHTITNGKTHEWITECTIQESGSLKETMK